MPIRPLDNEPYQILWPGFHRYRPVLEGRVLSRLTMPQPPPKPNKLLKGLGMIIGYVRVSTEDQLLDTSSSAPKPVDRPPPSHTP